MPHRVPCINIQVHILLVLFRVALQELRRAQRFGVKPGELKRYLVGYG